MNPSKTKTLPLIAGILLCLVAAVAFFLAFTNSRSQSNIMVAKDNISAFSYVDSSNVEASAVADSSITDNDLTEEEFQDLGEKFAVTDSFLAGQRIDSRAIAEETSSFGVVLPDERVVAVTSTLAGISGGLIKAGDIVDVQSGGSSSDGAGDTVSGFAKVLCVALDPNECQGVIPDGVSVPRGDQQTGEQILVILATQQDEAGLISGKEVTLSLNPFCRVDSRGYFISPRRSQGQDFVCAPDASRLASQRPKTEQG